MISSVCYPIVGGIVACMAVQFLNVKSWYNFRWGSKENQVKSNCAEEKF